MVTCLHLTRLSKHAGCSRKPSLAWLQITNPARISLFKMGDWRTDIIYNDAALNALTHEKLSGICRARGVPYKGNVSGDDVYYY